MPITTCFSTPNFYWSPVLRGARFLRLQQDVVLQFGLIRSHRPPPTGSCFRPTQKNGARPRSQAKSTKLGACMMAPDSPDEKQAGTHWNAKYRATIFGSLVWKRHVSWKSIVKIGEDVHMSPSEEAFQSTIQSLPVLQVKPKAEQSKTIQNLQLNIC